MNSGTAGVEVGVADGVAVGFGEGEVVDCTGDDVGEGVGVGVDVGFAVIVTELEAGEVTGVEALSVTLQVTECEPATAV